MLAENSSLLMPFMPSSVCLPEFWLCHISLVFMNVVKSSVFWNSYRLITSEVK